MFKELGEVIKDHIEGEIEKKGNSRTIDSIKAQMLHYIANNREVSGKQDFHQAHYTLIKTEITDAVFSDALKTVAKKILELFPNLTLVAGQNENLQ